MHWRAFIQLPDGSKLAAQVVNASEEGVCLLSARTFPVNAQLAVVIGVPLPHDASRVTLANVQGNVRYAVLSGAHFQIGLRLDKISDADKRRIREAISKH